MSGHQHRPGSSGLKQVNKTHKGGRHQTKGAITRKSKGKVEAPLRVGLKSATGKSTKQDRRAAARELIRQKKKDTVRALREGPLPPRIVVVIPLSANADTASLSRAVLTQCEAAADVIDDLSVPITVRLPTNRQRLTLVQTAREDISVLDAGKCADLVLFALSVSEGIDTFGHHSISLLKSQGLPAVIVTLLGIDDVAVKKRTETRTALVNEMCSLFCDDDLKVLPVSASKTQEVQQLVRFLGTQQLSRLHWRERRPYMLVDRFEQLDENAATTSATTSSSAPTPTAAATPAARTVTMKVSGYLRGAALSANDLVHLTGAGDFQLLRVEGPADPCPITRRADATAAEMELLGVPDAEQTSLQSENIPDPLMGEQTWPTDEELADADDSPIDPLKAPTRKRLVPKGTSSYQAAWIPEERSDDDDSSDAPEDSDDDDHPDDDDDDEAAPAPMYAKGKANANVSAAADQADNDDEADDDDDDEGEEMDDLEQLAEESSAPQSGRRRSASMATSVAGDDMDDEDAGANDDLEHELAEKRRAQQDDLAHPDEVDLDPSESGRARFLSYRGLKSFRSSAWDPYENLPREYARIFQFENFRRSAKRAIADRKRAPISAGRYVTLYIGGVPAEFANAPRTGPLLMCGLLRYEHRLSTLHFLLTPREPAADEPKLTPLAASEEVEFHVGFRRYPARPIYSQSNDNCDKHKSERFLHPGRSSIATIYGPVSFPPSPTLVFRRTPDGGSLLAATGTLHSVNPNRIILEKAVLTGSPFKINRRTATIRFMFFNPEDIRWFKPVQLYTRKGRVGHITEPLGTHGYFKASWDGVLYNNDVVCMALYKRIFPVWPGTSDEPTPTTSSSGSAPLTAALLSSMQS